MFQLASGASPPRVDRVKRKLGWPVSLRLRAERNRDSSSAFGVGGLALGVPGRNPSMTEQLHEPQPDEADEENREQSPPESVAPPEGQQEKSHESEDTLSPDEKSTG